MPGLAASVKPPSALMLYITLTKIFCKLKKNTAKVHLNRFGSKFNIILWSCTEFAINVIFWVLLHDKLQSIFHTCLSHLLIFIRFIFLHLKCTLSWNSDAMSICHHNNFLPHNLGPRSTLHIDWRQCVHVSHCAHALLYWCCHTKNKDGPCCARCLGYKELRIACLYTLQYEALRHRESLMKIFFLISIVFSYYIYYQLTTWHLIPQQPCTLVLFQAHLKNKNKTWPCPCCIGTFVHLHSTHKARPSGFGQHTVSSS